MQHFLCVKKNEIQENRDNSTILHPVQIKQILRIMPIIGTYIWANWKLAMLGQEALSAASLSLLKSMQRKSGAKTCRSLTETGSFPHHLHSPLLLSLWKCKFTSQMLCLGFR